MALKAGRLRHRVTIQRRTSAQDSTNGAEVVTWVDEWENVPAAIEPLSVREFIAAQATQSQVTAKITLRYRDGFLPTMRILHGAKIYSPAGFLPDANSGLEYVTVPVTEGVKTE